MAGRSKPAATNAEAMSSGSCGAHRTLSGSPASAASAARSSSPGSVPGTVAPANARAARRSAGAADGEKRSPIRISVARPRPGGSPGSVTCSPFPLSPLARSCRDGMAPSGSALGCRSHRLHPARAGSRDPLHRLRARRRRGRCHRRAASRLERAAARGTLIASPVAPAASSPATAGADAPGMAARSGSGDRCTPALRRRSCSGRLFHQRDQPAAEVRRVIGSALMLAGVASIGAVVAREDGLAVRRAARSARWMNIGPAVLARERHDGRCSEYGCGHSSARSEGRSGNMSRPGR